MKFEHLIMNIADELPNFVELVTSWAELLLQYLFYSEEIMDCLLVLV